LGESYEFKSLLGRGGSASVYLVHNRRLDRPEALKVLSQQAMDGEFSAQRFVVEAKVVASLDHPNLVKVYDFGEATGILWCTMQYIDGPTLRQELKAAGCLGEVSVATLAVALLDALEYSHSLGTIHRDIKPSNILLSARGRPYLTDFGIAISVKSNFHTVTGNLWGTPAYMAPEIIDGKSIDGRADLYSLGTLLYELLSGALPFAAENPVQMALKRVQVDAPPLSQVLPAVSDEVETLVMRALARNPEDRFGSAAEMRAAWVQVAGDDWRQGRISLKAAAPDLKELPMELGAEEAVARPAAIAPTVATRRFPMAAVLGLVFLLILLSGLGVWRWNSTAGPPTTLDEGPASAETPSSQVNAGGLDATSEEAQPNVSEEDSEVPMEAPDEELEVDAVEESPREVTQKAQSPAPVPVSPPVAPSPEPPLVRRPVTQPEILEAAEIRVTGDLVSLCAGSSVVATVEIDAEGASTSAKILRAAHPSCGTAVREALLEYSFRPAKAADGLPVKSKMTLSLTIGDENP